MREYEWRHRRKNPNRLLGQLPPDQAKAILGGEVPAQRPIGVRMADLADDDAAPLFARAAAAPAAQAKPIQLAQADTGTMTDAVPASAPQPQTAKPAPSAGSAPAQGQGIPAGTQANAGGAASRDYGAIADEFGLDRSMGEKAGAKAKEALDAMQAFRDGSDRSPAALNKVVAAAHKAESEDPEAARKIRGMVLDYKTNPLWQPRVMSETELKGRGGEDPAKRFGNLAGISGGATGAVGGALEAAKPRGRAGAGKAAWRLRFQPRIGAGAAS